MLRETIAAQSEAIICEGYTDVLLAEVDAEAQHCGSSVGTALRLST